MFYSIHLFSDRTHTAAKDSDSGPLDAEIDARV